MRFRFWSKQEPEEATVEPGVAQEPEPAPTPEPPTPEPEPAPAPKPPPPRVAPTPPPVAEVAPPEEAAPARVSLTIDEAKGVIREAGGDVIQVGFLASAYRRHLEEDPRSAETTASRKRLRELVGKRLKDRGLLAPDGTFELREGE
jgi:outer membrane biosynthesis protein TonB